ncbi:MAG: hypothetical protein ACRD3A_09885 [Terriglobales bacterium]
MSKLALMRRILVALLLLVSLATAQQPPNVVEVFREFDRIAAQPLWPGFEPRSIAVEVYDGANTYLYHHPKPPDGFRPLEAAPGVLVYPGQHETVRANTGTELNGVPTATADLSKGARSAREAASLLIHETFHVYEKKAHPKWAANEADLFLYPVEDWDLLYRRWRETAGLVDALRSSNEIEARCAADWALLERQERFSKMSPGAVAYERGTELNEGLAQYVEYKSIGKPAALQRDDFPLELIRQRGYATGQAFALLLDRFAPDWKTKIGHTPLDGCYRHR